MSAFAPPIGLGDVVLSANVGPYLADLGNEYLVGKIRVRLVRAVTADAAPAGRVKIMSVLAGVRQNKVDGTNTANDKDVAGVCLQGQGALAVGDLFLLQTGGVAQCITDDTVMVAGDMVGTSSVSSLGKVQGIFTATTLCTESLANAKLAGRRLGVLLLSVTAASAACLVQLDRQI